MENRPKVSVIIPCYNASATIRETLKSIKKQTFKDYEVIAVNDGSTDDTDNILASYAEKLNGLLKIITQINQGQAVAKNVGIRNSKGQFIAFLDSDDLWAPDKLEYQLAYMESRPHIGLCYTEGILINDKGDKIGVVNALSSHRGNCFDKLLIKNNIIASSVMIKREILDRVGLFDEDFKACENWDMWIRISKVSQIEYIDRPLTYYRVHPKNMSKNIDKMYDYRVKIIDKYLPKTNRDPLILEKRSMALFFTYLAFGKQHIENLELRKARNNIIQAIKLRPYEMICYRLYFRTLFGVKAFKAIHGTKKKIMKLIDFFIPGTINEEFGEVFTINNSCLKIIEPEVQESDLTIYKIKDNKLIPIKELTHKKNFIVLIEIFPNQVFAFKKVFSDLIDKIDREGRLRIVIATSFSKFNFSTIFSYYFIKRYLKKIKWVDIEVFGLITNPYFRIVMPFKRNIYEFIFLNFFGSMDNALKHFMKKLIIILFGQLVWRRSIAFMARNEKEILCPEKMMEYEPWLDNEKLQDRFIHMTNEKNIIFIFKKGDKKPKAVKKYGKPFEIKKEYVNQQKAQTFFPSLVPAIYFFKSDCDIGNLCMEYIGDIRFNKVVASASIGKKRKYLREIKDTFQLLIKMLKSLPFKEGKFENSYSYQIIKTTINGNLTYLNEKIEINKIKKIIEEVNHIRFPLGMQHGDFCLGNILYTDKNIERKVIIDWEDCREEDLPLVDFNMLLISMIQAYKDTFERKNDDFFNDNDIMKILTEQKEEIRQYLGMKKELFQKISILSTFSLWSQNVQKGRIKISEEVFSFLNKELS